MAAITTAAAGDWSSTGTWTGGVIPGNGDTVTLNHAVDVTDSRIVGTSPAAGSGTNAIRCNAKLSIKNGGWLKVRGDIGLNNVGLDLGTSGAGGGRLTFDASLAGTSSTARYTCGGINASDPNAIITIFGTSGNHSVIDSDAGGANGRFVNNGNDRSGMFNGTYCDFTRIGDASNPAMTFILQAADSFILANCTMDACGAIGSTGDPSMDVACTFSLTNIRRTNSPGNSIAVASAGRTTGVRVVTGDFDTFCQFYGSGGIGGYTIGPNVIFRGGIDSLAGKPDSFDRFIFAFAQADLGDWPVWGTYSNGVCVRLGAPTNPHYLTSSDLTDRITGIVFDCPDGNGGQANGDTITFNNPASARTITVDHCIGLHVSNQNVGTAVSCLGGANLTLIVEHNTFHGGQGIYLGETYLGYAGMVKSCRSNLSYHKTAGTGNIVFGDPGGPVADIVGATAAQRNGGWNVSGTGYNGTLSFSAGTTPGQGDVLADPLFRDVDRNVKTWDASLGGPGTAANALDAIGTGARTVQQLLDYIREGFTPHNAAFYNAHDYVEPSRGWIGAVAGPSLAPPRLDAHPMLRLRRTA